MSSDLNIKETLYKATTTILSERFRSVQQQFAEIQDAMLSETKSTAGDKHETGRAMLQLEREKLGNQLAEIQKVREVLLKINPATSSEMIHLGSVVYTSQANYFIAISAGQLTANNKHFYAIATNTPIGKLLLGKKAGDTIVFRNQSFVIEKVL